MNRGIRILTGGWLSTATSHFTRGWYEEAGAVVVIVPPVITPPQRTYNVPFEDRVFEVRSE